MSEFFEMWSLPWHALQRSLAKSGEALGVQAQAQTSPSGTPPCAGAAPAAGNWLMRALSSASHPAVSPANR